ncbi:MAG: Holliday junction resolvase RuvX [Brevinematia bacterium]
MGRILAIDYGEKRIGIAISDELRIIASPLDVLKNDEWLFERLKKLYEYYKFDKIVIGLPVFKNSKKSEKKVYIFGEKLKSILPVEIIYFNESYSTVYAENLLRTMGKKSKEIKSKVDKFAAQKILEDFLRNNPQ